MDKNKQDEDNIRLVKNGYNVIAIIYEHFADPTIASLEIFSKFVSLLNENRKILDLGCGSGKAISKYFLENDFNYTGVDISNEQIKLAWKNFPYFKQSFLESEMLEFCKSAEYNSFDGCIALFSIFHLPPTVQINLFKELKRILTNNSPFLFTCADTDEESYEENWLGGQKPMYWSNKPIKWYEETLLKNDYALIDKYVRKFVFANEEEIQHFLLFTT